MIPNALCSCGKSDETAKHFLLHCKNYIAQRNIFLIGIREISNDLPINELTLLFGNIYTSLFSSPNDIGTEKT